MGSKRKPWRGRHKALKRLDLQNRKEIQALGADATRRRTLFCDLLKKPIYLLKMPPTAITLAVLDTNLTYTQKTLTASI